MSERFAYDFDLEMITQITDQPYLNVHYNAVKRKVIRFFEDHSYVDFTEHDPFDYTDEYWKDYHTKILKKPFRITIAFKGGKLSVDLVDNTGEYYSEHSILFSHRKYFFNDYI